jgi:hypothetical protein
VFDRHFDPDEANDDRLPTGYRDGGVTSLCC